MMTPHQKADTIAVLQKALKIVEETPTTTRCIDCINLSNGFCAVWRQIVPEDFKKKGCEKFVFDSASPPF